MERAGGLLDYDSVREGLQSGQISHLGLDVQWVEPMDPQDWIAQHPRCLHLLFPHTLCVGSTGYPSCFSVAGCRS